MARYLLGADSWAPELKAAVESLSLVTWRDVEDAAASALDHLPSLTPSANEPASPPSPASQRLIDALTIVSACGEALGAPACEETTGVSRPSDSPRNNAPQEERLR